ncbi:coiled-coil and C2 domain-containing protein 2A-like [Varroa jacobsoni]|uniref:coiled-coil and C2 domain-containing protein 2A-like n=1 Tax=Varroa jacobsoni TaxID=62625 RepID=UPI000BF96213|nr:coiled-coil and C2 domain-containing protein 2A-like [Varroa jacobsoni]
METRRILQQRVRRRLQAVNGLRSLSEKSKAMPDLDFTLATERNNGIVFFLGTHLKPEKDSLSDSRSDSLKSKNETEDFNVESWKISVYSKPIRQNVTDLEELLVTEKRKFGDRHKTVRPQVENRYHAYKISHNDIAPELEENKRQVNLLDGLDGPSLRLEPFKDEFLLQRELSIEDRFSIMSLREKVRAPMKDITTLIPLYLREYQTKGDAGDSEELGDVESFQCAQSTVINKLRELVAEYRKTVQHHTTLESILIEDKAPGITSIGLSMLKVTMPRRPLRPRRKERKKVLTSSIIQGKSDLANAELIVTILRATNVPIRSDVERRVSSPNIGQAVLFNQMHDSIIQVRPFVEVSFQQNSKATFVSDGPNPTWNQQLTLSIRNDTFQGDNRDVIYLNICDQVVVDLQNEDGKDHIHQILERRWLGTLTIPFSTVYINSKIEGTFRMDSPPVLFGYEFESKQWPTNGEQSNFILLSLFITIEPPLQLPKMILERLPSGEPEEIFVKASKFQNEINAKFPNREVRCLTANIEGKMVLMTRFINPIIPPRDLLFDTDPLQIKMERLARFVSLIPTVSDSILFPGIRDIWTTCEQFLQVLVGDEEEHAILLCNYFLFCGVNAYILLGNGIPEGATAYVITINNAATGLDDRIWNAVTGRSYLLSDVNSPLQSVGCIISKDNVWANIQDDQRPCRVQFVLNKSNKWKPLFRGEHGLPLHTLQTDACRYTPPDKMLASKLESTLETHLRESIMRWRKQDRTIWNRNHCRMLRSILPKFEEHMQRKDAMGSEALLDTLASHKLSGFPLSMTFVSIKAVTDAVKSTGMHLTCQEGTEFALAAYVHAYPSQVFAVWIYVATITRRDHF